MYVYLYMYLMLRMLFTTSTLMWQRYLRSCHGLYCEVELCVAWRLSFLREQVAGAVADLSLHAEDRRAGASRYLNVGAHGQKCECAVVAPDVVSELSSALRAIAKQVQHHGIACWPVRQALRLALLVSAVRRLAVVTAERIVAVAGGFL